MLHFPTRRVEVCELKIPIHHLPSHLEGLKLVQLSDFHVGDHALTQAVLRDTIDRVKLLQPDLICYTGDFINGNTAAIETLCDALKSIQGHYGSVAVLGNHDHFDRGSAASVMKALQHINIRVLMDDVCYPMGPGLAMVGFKCLFAHHDSAVIDPAQVLAKIPEGMPKVVLTHSPQYSEFMSGWKIDLHLSGHTHGGQLSLPMMGPLLPTFWEIFQNLPRRLQHQLIGVLPRRVIHNQDCRYIQGMYHRNQGYLYVNRGLGSHFPGRLFCRPEITAITLVAN